MSFADDEPLEQTLLVVREVSVYKIAPRGSSGGYKCGEWLQSDKIWTGRLRVVSLNDACDVRLEDSNTGELFAECHVMPGKRDVTVENVVDSSRYFVLRIDDGRGKHAFIGLGFAERNEAFDFNVALSDHEKYVKREAEKEESRGSSKDDSPAQPSLDLRLKEGETIRINVKTKPVSGTGMLSGATGPSNVISSTGRMKAPLAPPPGGGRIRSPLPPPPNDNKSIRTSPVSSGTASRRDSVDPFSDLSQLEKNLPTSTQSGTSRNGSTTATAGGWAAF